MTTVLVIGIVILALFGAPIFACMAALALLGATALAPGLPIDQVFAGLLTRVAALATGGHAATLATIPLFTFAGYVMAESRTAERMVACARAWLGWLPGGLAVATIFACAIFTTFTGASGVTIVAIGSMILPSLLKEHYKERFALGLVGSTGAIGLLFPPALPIIVFGIVYAMSAQSAMASGESQAMELIDFSVERFLFAGIVPGLILCGMVGIYAVFVAIRDKVPRTPFRLGEAISTTGRALPEVLIVVLVIGTLASGLLQIPEAAALTALYVLLIERFVYRDIKLRTLPRVARSAMGLVGAIFIVIVSATILTDYFVNASVPERIYAFLDQHISSPWTFLLALNLLLLVVGCLMDIYSAILIVVPLIAPAAMHYGIDPYHLGVIFLVNLEIGYMTPPVGLNLFITSFRFRKPMVEVYRATFPFLLVMLATLGLVTYIPALTPIKARKPAASGAPATGPPPGAADAPDGGVPIVWPDGGVWEPSRCETPEMKDDPLEQAECRATFQMWARCAAIEDALDRLECEQKVLDGEDPFSEEEPPPGDEDPAAD
jgi:C4-dicarboxylate transporter, DctM subunit